VGENNEVFFFHKDKQGKTVFAEIEVNEDNINEGKPDLCRQRVLSERISELL